MLNRRTFFNRCWVLVAASSEPLVGSAAARVAALAALVPAVARAADSLPFTEAAFKTALAAGLPILVEITAPWCSTCKAQKPILSRLLQRPKFQKLTVFQVDFDSQKAAVRALGATQQSTLIAFKGGKPVSRSVGDTRELSILALLDQAV